MEFIDRQRNAVITYANAVGEVDVGVSASFTRTTPSFPTPNHTDPALTFGDGLYEAFNARLDR